MLLDARKSLFFKAFFSYGNTEKSQRAKFGEWLIFVMDFLGSFIVCRNIFMVDNLLVRPVQIFLPKIIVTLSAFPVTYVYLYRLSLKSEHIGNVIKYNFYLYRLNMDLPKEERIDFSSGVR